MVSCILLLNKNNVNKKEKNNLDSEHPTYIIDKNIEKQVSGSLVFS